MDVVLGVVGVFSLGLAVFSELYELWGFGSARDQALVLAHERIHQLLTPKIYRLRRFRVENRTASYFRSSLSRYRERRWRNMRGRPKFRGGWVA